MIRKLLGTQTESRDISYQDIFKRGLDDIQGRTAAGEQVSYDTSLTVSAVYGAIRLISDTISTLNFSTYENRNGIETPYNPIPEWLREMNPELTNSELLGSALVSLLLDGNIYLATLRDGRGQVLSLNVLDPTDITPKMVRFEDGTQQLKFDSSKNPEYTYTTRDIQMIRGMLKPSQIEGVSPIKAAREVIGSSIAINRYQGTFFGNGAIPGSIITVPNQLSPEAAKNMKEAFNETHRGAGNGHRLAVLTEGASWQRIALAGEDAQWLEAQRATVSDICRIYGLPPFLLADNEGSTQWGSGLHELNVGFVTYSMRPVVARLEDGLTKIMRSTGIGNAYLKFDLASMTRGTNERWETYKTALQNGIVNIDEVRAWEGLAPLPDGEGQKHYVPLNMAEVGAETDDDEVQE
tara:strand:+ start:1585 stop:2808 length:1224 start_codon:yes stop_codon:yes gene_type:complete